MSKFGQSLVADGFEVSALTQPAALRGYYFKNDSGSKSCLDRRHYDRIVHIGRKSTGNAGEICCCTIEIRRV